MSTAHAKFIQDILGKPLGGRYAVERILGEGGMGVVAAGRHPELDQPVAIKFMWPEYAADEALAKRFLQEGKVAAKVHSPHLVRVFDVGRNEAGVPYLVMEMLKGHDLDSELGSRGPLPIAEALDWFLQALVGLAEIHAAGIVHRDLKPANLFLCETPSGPVVKLLDFGISKDMKATGEGLTATDTMLGTPQYMSPEQVKSSKHVDLRSDIWTLGVILYELFTGKMPFRASSDSDGFGEVFGLILFKEPEPPSRLRPGFPIELEATILRCLRKDPAERFQNVASLADALRAFAPPSSSHRIESVRRTMPDLADLVVPPPSSSGLELAPLSASAAVSQPSVVTAKTIQVATPATRTAKSAPERAPQTAAPTTRRVPSDDGRGPTKMWALGGAIALATIGAVLLARTVLGSHESAGEPATSASPPAPPLPAVQPAATAAIAPLESATASAKRPSTTAPSSGSARSPRTIDPAKKGPSLAPTPTPRASVTVEATPLILDRK